MSKKISPILRRAFAVGVAALSLQVFVAEESSACSIHDHNCQFHGIGRAVNPNIDPSSGTAAFIITESVDPTNTLDFDNNVLLQDGFGPYIVSTTGFPATPGQPYIGPGEQGRHIYPSQFQIDFQANTAQARHSGDLNGLEIIPGATGCEYSTAANCEEIKITGNIPNDGNGIGFVVRQTNHLYNAQNTPNPEIDLQSYAVATGRAYILNFGHSANAEPALFQQNYNLDSLSGSRNSASALGDEHTYYIGYNDFDPHAVGADLWFNQRWQTSGNAYRVQGQHWYEDNLYKNVTTHKNKRFISGMGEETTGDYGKSTRQVFMGTVASQAYVAEQKRVAKAKAELLSYQLAQKQASIDFQKQNIPLISYPKVAINQNTINLNKPLTARELFYQDKLVDDGSLKAKTHAAVFSAADTTVQFAGGLATGIPNAVGELQYFALDKGRYINPSYYLNKEAYLGGLEVSADIRDSLSATTDNLQSNLTEISGGVYDPNASKYHAFANSTGEFVSPTGFVAKLSKVDDGLQTASEIAKAKNIGEGIYEFSDNIKPGVYVGQSGDISKRLSQHIKTGKVDPSTTVKITNIEGGKTTREIAEFNRIREITGGVPAAQSSSVSNAVDPLSLSRQQELLK